MEDAIGAAYASHRRMISGLAARDAARLKKLEATEDSHIKQGGGGDVVGTYDITMHVAKHDDDDGNDAERAESESTREVLIGDIIVGKEDLVCEFSEWLALRTGEEQKIKFAKLASHAQRWSVTNRKGLRLRHWTDRLKDVDNAPPTVEELLIRQRQKNDADADDSAAAAAAAAAADETGKPPQASN